MDEHGAVLPGRTDELSLLLLGSHLIAIRPSLSTHDEAFPLNQRAQSPLIGSYNAVVQCVCPLWTAKRSFQPKLFFPPSPISSKTNPNELFFSFFLSFCALSIYISPFSIKGGLGLQSSLYCDDVYLCRWLRKAGCACRRTGAPGSCPGSASPSPES